MKQGLSLRVSQHLALTPQLQQSIRLLQLSTLELGQEVEQMLDENPFLERSDDTAEREAFGLTQADEGVSTGDRDAEFAGASLAEPAMSSTTASTYEDDATPLTSATEPDWGGDGTVEMAPDDSEWGGDARAAGQSGDDQERDGVDLARSHESLVDHLTRQAAALRLNAVDRAALKFLIGSLNDDGYLEEPLEELARTLNPEGEEQLQELVHHFTVALRLLQAMEPIGVGARDLQDCLRLQLRALLAEVQTPVRSGGAGYSPEVLQTALGICVQPLELLARRDVRKLVALGVGAEDTVREALACIARLEPKPGRRFADVERNAVVPDVLVVPVTTARSSQPRFRVTLNPDVMPRLRVQDVYANALRGHRDGAGHAALQQRLQEARWFIKNIQQRFDTILRVSSAIVERQKNFFVHGELAMRPLVLREIADELGLHESTISRVTTAKYMATPFGTFELKYFFGSGLGTETGGNTSSTAVRALIRQFISAENVKKPLSDSQLSDMLKEQGIECARRTVAKYREGLRIAPASLRKQI